MGYGDPPGMHATNLIASGMGGIRTTGDLVARMQLNKKMRLTEAKQYVADKLKVSLADICDEVAMKELRTDLDIGNIYMGYDSVARGIEAKHRIGELLGIEINAVKRFKEIVNRKLF